MVDRSEMARASMPIRVLLAEDDDGEAARLEAALHETAPARFSVHRARTLEAARGVVAESGAESGADVVLLSLGLEGMRGANVVARLCGSAPSLPIVALIDDGEDEDERGEAAVRMGADDFISRGRADARLLPYVVERSARRWRALESERRLSSFPQENPNPIIACDVRGEILYANPATRHTAQSLDIQDLRQLLPEDHKSILAACLASGVGREDVPARVGGVILSWNYHPSARRDEVRLYARDITRRVRTEKALREERDFVAAIVRTIGALIVVLDRDARIIHMNPAAERLSGRTLKELRGASAFDVLLPDNERGLAWELFRSLAREQDSVSGRFTLVSRDGPGRLVDWTATVVQDEGGGMRYAICTGLDVSAREQAQRDLVLSEERYRVLAEHATDMISRCDPDAVYTYVSPACFRLLGHEADEMIGKPSHAFVHPDDVERVREEHARLLEGETRAHLVHRLLRRDGATLWVETTANLVRDREGQVAEIVTVTRDATARRQVEEGLHAVRDELENRIEERTVALEQEMVSRARAEEAMRNREQHLRMITDAMPAFIAYVDPERRFQYVNRAFEEWFSLPRELITGRAMEEVMGPELYRGFTGFVDHVLSGAETSFDVTVPDVGGHPRHLHATFLPHVGGGEKPEGFFVLIQDITERKEAEEAMRRSEEKYRALMDHAADAILLIDERGLVVEANRRAGDLLGRPRRDLAGLSFGDLLPPQERERVLERITGLEAGVTLTLPNHMVRRAHGGLVPVDIALALVQLGRRRIGQAILRDISAHKQAEEQLREAKETAELADRAKTEFLANMSHELRTPLNAIIGFSDIMSNELMGPVQVPAYREYVRDIGESGRHLLEVINEILDMSKVESGQVELLPEPVDIPELARSAMRMVRERAEEAGVRLVCDLSDDLPEVEVDQRRFKQILLNLLSNAVKFTPAGGDVTIRAGLDADGMVIHVKDTGIGMSAEDIAKALVPFGQVDSRLARKYDGTGLGLPLTKAFAELHGGRLRIESAVGTGTCVSITVPMERVLGADATAIGGS